jgi:hypothetical protein
MQLRLPLANHTGDLLSSEESSRYQTITLAGELMRTVVKIFVSLLLVMGMHPAALPAKTAAKSKATGKITNKNWYNHPDIIAVRKIFEAAQKQEKSAKTKTREFDEDCAFYEGDLRRSITIDDKAHPLIYVRERGSDDSAVKLTHYYDQDNRLRFVMITGGAANGSKLEHRIYFNEKGERIFEKHQYVKGPGYTFPEVWPASELIMTEPQKAFEQAQKCGN